MAAIDNQPDNKNFLSPIGFKFVIKKTPHINYFVQTATLPSLQLGTSNVDTPFVKFPLPGDHLNFGDFSLTYKVDEDLKNYLEIYNWMIALGFPDNFDQYKSADDIRQGPITGQINRMSGLSMITDGTLIILSSSRNPIHEVVFENIFPTSLSELQFTSTDTDVSFLTSTVTFAYQKYSIKSV
jgi:hypothetical protein